MIFRLLLVSLGLVLTTASRFSERFRRQLTRDLVIELSSEDGVARQFLFRGRRASSRSGRFENPDCALRFASAGQGVGALIGSSAGHRLFAGLFEGTIRIEGRAALLPWFQGLLPGAVPVLPVLALPKRPPGSYVRPAAGPEVAKRILIEPAVQDLDPEWTQAAVAREKLLMRRVAAGEAPGLF